MLELDLNKLAIQIKAVLDSEGNSLRSLAKAAELDPEDDFQGANLSKMDLSGEDLSGFNFAGADLTQANLRSANLAGANLASANLAGAHFELADLSAAKVENAKGIESVTGLESAI